MDVTTEEMTDEGLVGVSRITLLMSDMIDGLEVMEVGVTGVGRGGGVREKKKKKKKDVVGANDGTSSSGTCRTRRARRCRRRRLKDEAMSYDVYLAQDERGGRVLGPIIAKTMSDEELFVDFINGDAHGYGPAQVDSEGSLRWRFRKRYCC